jgi:CHAT domain-containing protein
VEALRRAQLWLRDGAHADLMAYVDTLAASRRLAPAQVSQLRAAIETAARIDPARPFRHPFHWAAFQYHGL